MHICSKIAMQKLHVVSLRNTLMISYPNNDSILHLLEIIYVLKSAIKLNLLYTGIIIGTPYY
jgi:hypothetical protein